MKCPECEGELVLKKSRHGLFYGCTNFPRCRAAHGAHPDGRPLGIPAGPETKKARMKAHDVFDAYWKAQGMQRKKAYKWLAERMGMTKDECHIGRFNQEQCEAVIQICKLSQ